MRIPALLLAAAIAAAGIAGADAATLRASATVDADVVRVGDIFDDAGHLAEAVIAPAPRPGRRYVLDANWLADNARAVGIDWRPSSRFDRIVVERPGRIVGREAISDALREALRLEGAPAGAGIEYAGRAPELSVPLQAPPGLEVQSLSFDRASGRFSAMVVAGAGHASAQRLPVSGRLVATRQVPVLRRAVQAGEIVRASDVEFVEVREEALRRDVLVDAGQVVGQSEALDVVEPPREGPLRTVGRPSGGHRRIRAPARCAVGRHRHQRPIVGSLTMAEASLVDVPPVAVVVVEEAVEWQFGDDRERAPVVAEH
ncbi:MAG: SAF domain-containing protein, partial [Alphaproteobacteria bacterium]